MATSHYRPEIDGLRAVAVLAVVAYHIAPNVVSGGFLGVDVFFVISGYLITSLLLADLQNDTFSIRRFYERRARRILPALLVVILACIPLAWMTMDATELLAFGRSVLSQLIFASNFLFWWESGYFAAPAETMPLLHTWSLAVEEQFYLLFPLALFLGWRYLRQHLGGAIVVTCAVSLALAEIERRFDPGGAFYLLPSRAWELAIGAWLAWLERTNNRPLGAPWQALLLPTIGLVAIVLSMLRFTSATAHPSYLTVPLVVGTALFIRYGDRGIVAKAMAWKPIVSIGLISYSLYLWHWPLLAFIRLNNVGELPADFELWLVPAIFLLSWLSWRFVERPFRDRQRLRIRPFVAIIASTWLALVGVGGAFLFARGFPSRLPYPPGLEASFDREPTIGTCVDNPRADVKADGWYCELGPKTVGPIDFVVTGDSHAYAALPAFRALAKTRDVRAIAISDSGCPPLLGIEPIRGDQDETNCPRLNTRLYGFAAQQRPKAIFLVARWTYYTVFDALFRVTSSDIVPTTPEARLSALRDALKRTVADYDRIGAKVVLLGQVPMQPYSPRKIYKAAYLSSDVSGRLRELSARRADHVALQCDLDKMFVSIPGLDFIDPTPAYCDGDRCPVGTPAESVYSDQDHLSIVGSLRLRPLLELNSEKRQSPGC